MNLVCPRRHQQQGFNLIEVLLALFIVAIVIGATASLTVDATRNVANLERSIMANWVGLNQIALAQLAQEGEGERSGEVEMAGRIWFWQQEIKPTEGEADLLEIIIEVFEREDDPDSRVAIVKGFRALP